MLDGEVQRAVRADAEDANGEEIGKCLAGAHGLLGADQPPSQSSWVANHLGDHADHQA
ncbi:hypothetical protein D3C85_1884260 [compost metagenome]